MRTTTTITNRFKRTTAEIELICNAIGTEQNLFKQYQSAQEEVFQPFTVSTKVCTQGYHF